MKDSDAGDATSGRVLNAIALQHAVLCAECDVISDSPHDRCMVCGSPSLVNMSRVLGGNLPKNRAALIAAETGESTTPNRVLSFHGTHTIRRRMARRAA